MRLIDADVLEPHEQLEPMGNGEYEFAEVVYKDDIDNTPTIDAVPVVRCRDCKYSHMTTDGRCKYCDELDAEGGAWYFEGDFFCAYGERREDGKA